MSTDIYEGDSFSLTQYNGGDEGQCIQITKTGMNPQCDHDYITLTRKQARELMGALHNWDWISGGSTEEEDLP